MGKRPMLMPMSLRFACRIFRPVLMLMMFVVAVRMHVRHWHMGMWMLVMLGEMQPNT
jgi:hypothetical protein